MTKEIASNTAAVAIWTSATLPQIPPLVLSGWNPADLWHRIPVPPSRAATILQRPESRAGGAGALASRRLPGGQFRHRVAVVVGDPDAVAVGGDAVRDVEGVGAA